MPCSARWWICNVRCVRKSVWHILQGIFSGRVVFGLTFRHFCICTGRYSSSSAVPPSTISSADIAPSGRSVRRAGRPSTLQPSSVVEPSKCSSFTIDSDELSFGTEFTSVVTFSVESLLIGTSSSPELYRIFLLRTRPDFRLATTSVFECRSAFSLFTGATTISNSPPIRSITCAGIEPIRFDEVTMSA